MMFALILSTMNIHADRHREVLDGYPPAKRTIFQQTACNRCPATICGTRRPGWATCHIAAWLDRLVVLVQPYFVRTLRNLSCLRAGSARPRRLGSAGTGI